MMPGQDWFHGLEFSGNPWPAITVFVVMAGLVVFVYLRRYHSHGTAKCGSLLVLRLLALALLLLMVTQPRLLLKPDKMPTLALIIDDSLSMGIRDVPRSSNGEVGEHVSRWEQVVGQLTRNNARTLHALADRFEPRIYFASEQANSAPSAIPEFPQVLAAHQPHGGESRLGAAVDYVIQQPNEATPQTVVLVSDGNSTHGDTLDTAVQVCQSAGVPLYLVGTGNPESFADVFLANATAPRRAYAGDMLAIEIPVYFQGKLETNVTLRLRDVANPDEILDEILDERRIEFPEQEPAKTVSLFVRPGSSGTKQYRVEAVPFPGEIHTANNQTTVEVEVINTPLRVLLAQNYPNFEYRYLKAALERDPTIELSTYLQQADPGYVEIDRSAISRFPLRYEDFLEYDVIIFGDIDPRLLARDAGSHLERFASEFGGGLVFIAGPRHLPKAYTGGVWQVLFPFQANTPITLTEATSNTPFQVMPTEAGMSDLTLQLGTRSEDNLETWANLPPLFWRQDIGIPKPATQVLAIAQSTSSMRATSLPIFLQQRLGAGNVRFHATDSTWRWRIRNGDVFFARYWTQTLRALSKTLRAGVERQAGISLDRRRYAPGEEVRVAVRFFDHRTIPESGKLPRVAVTDNDTYSQTIELRNSPEWPARFEAEMSALPAGSYRATLLEPTLQHVQPSVTFQVEALPGELDHPHLNERELKIAAEATGGKYLHVNRWSDLIDELPLPRATAESPPSVVDPWHRWPVLALFLALLTTEWYLLYRWGWL